MATEDFYRKEIIRRDLIIDQQQQAFYRNASTVESLCQFFNNFKDRYDRDLLDIEYASRDSRPDGEYLALKMKSGQVIYMKPFIDS